MTCILMVGMVIGFLALLATGWLGWQLVHQNGRMLLRMEALQKRLDEIESAKQEKPEPQKDTRANRFGSHVLANSKIKRDGLKAGTVAPEFRLPRLDGGELALSELRGRVVLLVFSSPHCGPCNILAPKLQKFHRKYPQLELVMISRESQDENRAKVKEHGLTFPVALQKQ